MSSTSDTLINATAAKLHTLVQQQLLLQEANLERALAFHTYRQPYIGVSLEYAHICRGKDSPVPDCIQVVVGDGILAIQRYNRYQETPGPYSPLLGQVIAATRTQQL